MVRLMGVEEKYWRLGQHQDESSVLLVHLHDDSTRLPRITRMLFLLLCARANAVQQRQREGDPNSTPEDFCDEAKSLP